MLKIDKLSVTIGEKQVLTDLSLILEPGKIQVLMGPNGSGKSSLAYAVLGHPRYTILKGTMSVGQKDLLTLPVHERAREGIFLATQYPQELPGVRVITFLKEAFYALMQTALEIEHFQEKIYRLLDQVGLDRSFAHRTVNEGFSGGEKKRFELLQLLLFKPRYAILDEIDSGLDIDGLKNIASVLEQVFYEQPALSVLIITHNPRLFNYINPDKIYILKEGQIAATGTDQLLKQIEQQGYQTEWTSL